MKKVTRLLILTAFVFPIFSLSRAYAGNPHPGQPGHLPEQSLTPGNNHGVGSDLFRIEDPGAGYVPDNNRGDVHWKDLDGGRDHFPRDHHPGWGGGKPGSGPGAGNGGGPGNGGSPGGGVGSGSGGATAPIDGGIGLLLAAGLGLGLKRARDRKKAIEKRAIENAQ
jgi:hypothetical protein